MHVKHQIGLVIKWDKCLFQHRPTFYLPPPNTYIASKKVDSYIFV